MIAVLSPRSLRRLPLVLPALLCVAASAASFDCAKARTETEKRICADPALSKLDEDLNAAYQAALSSAADRPLLVQWQRDWLKAEVLDCATAGCLKDAIAARIALLRRIAPKGSEPTTWNGTYVRYRRGKADPDSATIRLVGLEGGAVHIGASALWHGPDAKSGQVNEGRIDGVGKVSGGRIEFDLDGCRGKMKLKEATLVVEDESGCGGLNVTFNGEFRRK